VSEQCSHQSEWVKTAETRVKELRGAPLASLKAELDHTRSALQSLQTARDSLAETLLSRRSKDMDPEIRKSCVEALDRWTKSDAQTSRQAAWKQYLHWATSDPDAKVRTAALAALTAMLRADPGAEEVRSLAEDVRPNVIKRCNDVDASASAAALRCAVVLAELGSLPEDEYDPIVDLIWDKDEQRRTEAATFVSRFVFSEDVFDYAGAHISAGSLLPVGPPAESRRRLRMLLEFMEDYDEGHKELADRLAAALWCKASCLEDFEAFASLLLGSEVLPPDLHTRLVFLAEATVRRAFEDFNGAKESKHAEAVLDRAVRAFLPRLPALLEACQAEQAAMRRATALCSHLLHHCAYQRRGEERPLGAAGEAAAEAMKAAYLRQTDPEATEHIALALSYLIPLCPGARPIVRSMAATLRTRFMQTAALLLDDTGSAMQQEESKVPPMENLLATAQYLRILTKAADVSECDIEGFMTAVLQLIDQRQDSQRISPQLTVVLLELASLLLVRFAALSMGKRPPCVEHDEADAEKLKKAPTAVEDLMELATGLLESDENPRVRTAAFVSALCVAGAWWNAAHFAKTSGLVEDSSMSWVPSLDERLSHALSGHLGRLLEEANAIPEDTIFHTGTLEAEGILRPSAISQVFSLLSQGLASESPVTDAETVRLVRLTSLVVVRCRHREVVQGNLPSLLLSMSLSPRADVREVAWSLIKLLRTQAHDAPEAAQEFFKALLKAVKIVHQDNGANLGNVLSQRLLQHVGVGKLSPSFQSALLGALRRGVADAPGAAEGFLEALTPWITKHVVEDHLLEELADWAQAQGARDAEAFERSGLEAFVAACRTTSSRSSKGKEKEAEARNEAPPQLPPPSEAPSKRRRTKGAARSTPASTQELRSIAGTEEL